MWNYNVVGNADRCMRLLLKIMNNTCGETIEVMHEGIDCAFILL